MTSREQRGISASSSPTGSTTRRGSPRPAGGHSRRSKAGLADHAGSERTVSVPACLRRAHFAAVCCSAEIDLLQADSASRSLMQPVRLDFNPLTTAARTRSRRAAAADFGQLTPDDDLC